MSDHHPILSLSARAIAAQVGAGTLSATAVTEAFLAHIKMGDGPIKAFETPGEVQALAAAQKLDTCSDKGALAGVPVGVKDVFDTADLPTGYGSKAYHGFRPAADAAMVAISKAAGGIVLGKTVSTEFAMMSPNQTRNPHDVAHTPGGSSSGSCAAVAAGMVRLAFGTQTSGSVIRPASFCGVVGYKPSFGMLNRTGMKPLSDMLDTVGIITRDVGDAAWCTSVLSGNPALALADDAQSKPIRIAMFKTSRWDTADASGQQVLEDTAALLSQKPGVTISEMAVPDWFEDLYQMHDAIMGWEVTQTLTHERLHLSDQITDVTKGFLAEKAKITVEDYWRARRLLPVLQAKFAALMEGTDALLTLSAVGEAPKGMPTGDPVFAQAWTMLQVPAISIPASTGPNGLPIGVQLIGAMNDDRGLLSVAAHVEACIENRKG